MGYLEDRILQIIELKQQGNSDALVAQTLNLNEEQIRNYETSVKKL